LRQQIDDPIGIPSDPAVLPEQARGAPLTARQSRFDTSTGVV
jgi:hypothetical protein